MQTDPTRALARALRRRLRDLGVVERPLDKVAGEDGLVRGIEHGDLREADAASEQIALTQQRIAQRLPCRQAKE